MQELDTELSNVVELIQMSGEAFRTREMEIILDAALATLHYCKVMNLFPPFFSVDLSVSNPCGFRYGHIFLNSSSFRVKRLLHHKT
jgi:hypothetical protein